MQWLGRMPQRAAGWRRDVPSYMATRSEKHSTRGRANVLREALLHPKDALKPFNSEEVREVMELCLSCKACKSECPANVDMAKLKAEFLQHYHDAHGAPLRSRVVARFASISRIASFAPQVWNAVFSNPTLRRTANRFAGFHPGAASRSWRKPRCRTGIVSERSNQENGGSISSATNSPSTATSPSDKRPSSFSRRWGMMS